jgi:NitT/TauT family transport system substrate-binding protein
MKIRIGHLSTLYHTSTLMMARPEILSGFPADIEWMLFGTGPAIVEAFKIKNLDMAYIGLPPAVAGIASGLPLKCVAGGHVEGTVIAGRRDFLGFPETEDLAGILGQAKCIGVPGKGSIHDIILQDSVEKHKIPAQIKNFGWADRVLEEFVKGEVDIVAGTPALAQAVIHYGGGRLLYPPHLLWPENPSYGILVKEKFVKDERELLQDFLIRHERATAVLRDDREETAADIARFLKVVDAGFARDVLSLSPRYCAALSPGYIACAMRLTRRMQELDYLEREMSQDEIFDTSLIKAIHPGPAHYYS